MYKIDKTDILIINLLLEDGRKSASEIARHIGGISGRVVRYRIDRMLEAGIFQVSAILRPQAFDLDVYADVWMEVESDRIPEVAKKMSENENVTYVASSLGEADVSIQVVAKDTEAIYRFVTEIVRKVPGVRRTVTSIVPNIHKDIYQWRIPHSVLKDVDE